MDLWLARAKLKCVLWSEDIKELVCHATCRYVPKEQSNMYSICPGHANFDHVIDLYIDGQKYVRPAFIITSNR